MRLIYHIGAMGFSVATLCFIFVAIACIRAEGIGEVFDGLMIFLTLFLGIVFASGFAATFAFVKLAKRFLSNSFAVFAVSGTAFCALCYVINISFIDRFSLAPILAVFWFLNFAVSYAFILISGKLAEKFETNSI